MLKSKKIDEDIFEFKHSVIAGPVFGGIIAGILGGVFMNIGMQGNWTETGEDMAIAAVGGGVMLIGVAVLLFVPHINAYTFNRQNNQIKYEKKRLLPNKHGTYPLGQVSHILVSQSLRRRRRSRSSSGGSRRRTRTEVITHYMLEFNNGARIEIGRKKRRNTIMAMTGGVTPKPLQELSTFLGINIEEMTLKDKASEAAGAVKEAFTSAKAGKTDSAEDQSEELPRS